jgi:hypothetical protein
MRLYFAINVCKDAIFLFYYCKVKQQFYSLLRADAVSVAIQKNNRANNRQIHHFRHCEER